MSQGSGERCPRCGKIIAPVLQGRDTVIQGRPCPHCKADKAQGQVLVTITKSWRFETER